MPFLDRAFIVSITAANKDRLSLKFIRCTPEKALLLGVMTFLI